MTPGFVYIKFSKQQHTDHMAWMKNTHTTSLKNSLICAYVFCSNTHTIARITTLEYLQHTFQWMYRKLKEKWKKQITFWFVVGFMFSHFRYRYRYTEHWSFRNKIINISNISLQLLCAYRGVNSYFWKALRKIFYFYDKVEK